MQKAVSKLQGLSGSEATAALYGKPSTIIDAGFAAMPDNYRNDLRAIMLSLEHRPDLLSLETFFVSVNLETRSMRPASKVEAAKAAINEGFEHGLRFDRLRASWRVTDLGTGEVIHAPDVFSETISY